MQTDRTSFTHVLLQIKWRLEWRHLNCMSKCDLTLKLKTYIFFNLQFMRSDVCILLLPLWSQTWSFLLVCNKTVRYMRHAGDKICFLAFKLFYLMRKDVREKTKARQPVTWMINLAGTHTNCVTAVSLFMDFIKWTSVKLCADQMFNGPHSTNGNMK